MKFPQVYRHLCERLPITSWFSKTWHNPSIHNCSDLISKCRALRQVLRISKSGNGDVVMHHVMQNSQYSDRKAKRAWEAPSFWRCEQVKWELMSVK